MQYVEENDRLRAILGEWSARAAKVLSMKCYCGLYYKIITFFLIIISVECVWQLERALEAERASNVELRKNIAKLRGHLYKEQEAWFPLSSFVQRAGGLIPPFLGACTSSVYSS